jgi:hypothetical protein
MQLSALSNRGQLADLEQQNEALNIVAEVYSPFSIP